MNVDELENLLSHKLGYERVRRSGENITACCPSHNETRPSWGIRTDEPHLHACFACGFKGTLRTLLLHEGWTITAINNLLGKTSRRATEFTLANNKPLEVANEEELWPFVLEADAVRYMRQRGIVYATLQQAKVVYHPLDQRVLFPWYWNKKFYGATGRTIDPTNPAKIQAYFGLSKSKCLYSPVGHLPKKGPVVIVEGEIDALKVTQAGHSAIALGHSHLSDAQVGLFESLPVNFEFVLMLDRDDVGQRLSVDAFKALRSRGFKNVRTVDWDLLFKKFYGKIDPGEIAHSAIRSLVRRAKLMTNWSIG